MKTNPSLAFGPVRAVLVAGKSRMHRYTEEQLQRFDEDGRVITVAYSRDPAGVWVVALPRHIAPEVIRGGTAAEVFATAQTLANVFYENLLTELSPPPRAGRRAEGTGPPAAITKGRK